MTIEAVIQLRTGTSPPIGRERVRLLEAVAREGSITAGAKAFGLTYKAAWDALEAMANLFGQALLETRAGGRSGGGATLTPTGARVIRVFHRLEAEMARAVREIEPDLAGGGIGAFQGAPRPLARTSARNALRGMISAVTARGLTSDVALALPGGAVVHSLVTTASVEELGLCRGREAIALIKAPLVDVALPEEAARGRADNRLAGSVRRCRRSAATAEVDLDIGAGTVLSASIATERAKALGLRAGAQACALFAAAHVIVAID